MQVRLSFLALLSFSIFALLLLHSCRTTEPSSTERLAPFLYTVDATQPEREEFVITLSFARLSFHDEEIFSLPAWAPALIN